MKRFECSSLVPGCTWHTRHETEAEVTRRVTEHLRASHSEMTIRPQTVEAIKAKIIDEEPASA